MDSAAFGLGKEGCRGTGPGRAGTEADFRPCSGSFATLPACGWLMSLVIGGSDGPDAPIVGDAFGFWSTQPARNEEIAAIPKATRHDLNARKRLKPVRPVGPKATVAVSIF